MVNAMPDARHLSKLRWRCRRGLLENDLLLEKFFERHEHTLTLDQAHALERLMDLSDNDLLDLLLSRKTPEDLALVDSTINCVIQMLRPS